jgi:hypothetical protein
VSEFSQTIEKLERDITNLKRLHEKGLFYALRQMQSRLCIIFFTYITS